MKKRVLSLVLAAVMVCALLPVTAMAAGITVTEAVPCKYDSVGSFYNGFAAVKFNDKWGFIDRTGKEVVACKYDEVGYFSEGLAPVKVNGKCSFIDKTGKVVLSTKYAGANSFSEGLAAVMRNGSWGYIDKTGKEVISCQYVVAEAFFDGFAAVRSAGWGFIDKTGKEVVPCKYDAVGPVSRRFYDGLAGVAVFDEEKNEKWGFVDQTGKEVVPCQYDDAIDGEFSEGLTPLYKEDSSGNRKWGYIDKTGKEVLSYKYDHANGFSEGLAGVMVNGKWGYIDKTGREVIPPQYALVFFFHDGLAPVMQDGKWGYIDKTGKAVVPCKYDWAWIMGFSCGLSPVGLGGKFGYVDKTGREAVPCEYESADAFSEGMAAVKQNGKWGFIAIDGYVPLVLNGGSGVDYIIADSSNILTVPTNPTKPGYTFGGWYTDAALTTPWNFNNKVVNGLTLFAKWVPVSSTATKTGKSQSVISLNGSAVTLDAYTLKAANGGDVTYVKLRDIAALLENTNAKFNVDWRRGAIYVASKSAYTTKNGTELKAISGTDGSYQWNTAPVLFDGTTKALEGIVITDGKGGGHTFFKLRDLGEAIGFTVGWTAQRGIFIETK